MSISQTGNGKLRFRSPGLRSYTVKSLVLYTSQPRITGCPLFSLLPESFKVLVRIHYSSYLIELSEYPIYSSKG